MIESVAASLVASTIVGTITEGFHRLEDASVDKKREAAVEKAMKDAAHTVLDEETDRDKVFLWMMTDSTEFEYLVRDLSYFAVIEYPRICNQVVREGLGRLYGTECPFDRYQIKILSIDYEEWLRKYIRAVEDIYHDMIVIAESARKRSQVVTNSNIVKIERQVSEIRKLAAGLLLALVAYEFLYTLLPLAFELLKDEFLLESEYTHYSIRIWLPLTASAVVGTVAIAYGFGGVNRLARWVYDVLRGQYRKKKGILNRLLGDLAQFQSAERKI